MSRDDDIEAILEHGRRTRKLTPRWLWLVAALVGGGLTIAFAIVVLAADEPTASSVARRPASGGGLGIGLLIGACVGIVIGFSIARQRAGHSSRNNP